MSYAWNASDYAQHSSQQQRWARGLMARLALRGDEIILDLGCGDGKVTAEIARRVPRGRVVGADSSAEMIRFAQSHAGANLSFEVHDAAHLAFDGVFDIAFSNAALHWVPDQPAVLAGVARALKPGGRLLFQLGAHGNAAAVVAAMDQVRNQPPWPQYFNGFVFPWVFPSDEQYASWLSAAALKPIRLEVVPKDMVHAGADGLAGFFRTAWLPYTQRVPAEQREAFIQEVVHAYLRVHPADAAGLVHVPMVRLEVEAGQPG